MCVLHTRVKLVMACGQVMLNSKQALRVCSTYPIITKKGFALLLAGLELPLHFLLVMADIDTHATTTSCGLEHHGVAHLATQEKSSKEQQELEMCKLACTLARRNRTTFLQAPSTKSRLRQPVKLERGDNRKQNSQGRYLRLK